MWDFGRDPAAVVLLAMLSAQEVEREALGLPSLLDIMTRTLAAHGPDAEIVPLDARRLDPGEQQALRDAIRFLEFARQALSR